MAKFFVLLLEICSAKELSYHQAERIVSMARWCLQLEVTHLLDKMYKIMTAQRVQHDFKPDAPLYVRKNIKFPVTRQVLQTMIEIILQILHNVQTWNVPVPQVTDVEWYSY